MLRACFAPGRSVFRHVVRSHSSTPGGAVVSLEDKFTFDLNGYIILRGVLSKEEVSQLNTGIDVHKEQAVSRDAVALKNTKSGSRLSATGSRSDLGGMLTWQEPHGSAFRSLLAHPRIAPYLTTFLGEGYRLDHQPLVLMQDENSEGFMLHGGPMKRSDDHTDGVFNPELQYRYSNGTFFNTLLAMSVCLCDTNEGDGGFCVIRGSHKLNFAVPEDFEHGDSQLFREHAHQPVTQAGDVILFSEATVHGAFPWTAPRERRLALYRFAPPTVAYGRAYLEQWDEVAALGTPAQAAVLQAPFAPRLQRKVAPRAGDAGGEPTTFPRGKAKLEHDKRIFGTDTF